MKHKRNNHLKKRKKKRKEKSTKLSSLKRKELVLQIIKTDSTFTLHTFRDDKHQVWVGKCIHCNARMTVAKNGDTDFTIEHLVPKYAGGGNNLENLALSCGDCNHEKGRRHDKNFAKSRPNHSHEVISALIEKRLKRFPDRDR